MKRMVMLMLWKMRWRLMMFRMMMLRRRTDPKTGNHTLREPAQSKCTWTCHKSPFMRKITGKKSGPRPRQAFCAGLRSRNAHGHATRASLCRNLQVKGRRPRVSQTGAACFVRVCAVEMHMVMSQEPSYAEIYRENAAPQDPGNRFMRACAVEMDMDMSQEPFYARIYKKNATPQGLFCAGLRSRNAH